MMAATVVPARSCSIATTCAFLLPARVLATAEVAITGTGRFDDLRLVVFAGRERVVALGLDFVLVMGSSRGLRDAIRRTTSAPPRQMTQRGSAQKPRLSGSHCPQQCSVCSGMPVHSEQDDSSFPAAGSRRFTCLHWKTIIGPRPTCSVIVVTSGCSRTEANANLHGMIWLGEGAAITDIAMGGHPILEGKNELMTG
jgi:hypothetical protein